MSEGPHEERWDDRRDDRRDDPVGSAAEEAARLFGALGDWAREHAGGLEDHLATGAPECTYCPVCRTVHVIREAGPEVRVHLAGAAASLMQAAAAVLHAAATPPGPAPRDAGVQRIDLDDADAGAYDENGRESDPGDRPGSGSWEDS